ncbi:MAG: AI-2E family transporter [Bacteroidota bacterium]|nr:AI-2E family transporter [Bacteroidota bacterium]
MNKIQKYLIGGLSLLAVLLFFYFFGNIVTYILIAAVLSMIGRPIITFLTRLHIKKFRLPRWGASLITMAFFVFLIVGFLRLIIPLVGQQVSEFSTIESASISQNLEDPYQEIDAFVHSFSIPDLADFSSKEFISEKIVEIVQFNQISELVNNVGGTLGSILIGIFAVLFISFFFMKDSNLFDRGVMMIIPEKHEYKAENALKKIKILISRYFIGLVLQVIGITTLVTTGLMLSGVEFPLAILIGIIAGFLNLIPYIGPWIGAVLGIVLVIAGNLGMDFNLELLPLLIFVLLTFVITQMIDVFLFQPLIFSNSVRAHPLEIFLVILIGSSVAGILGMLLAIPTYTVLRVIAKEFFSQFKFIRSLTKNMDKE